MKRLFDRAVYAVAGLALLLDGMALVDFVLHPAAGDYNFNSALYRSVTALAVLPFTLMVAFLIVKRVPGNIVGPLLIAWSGTIAYNSMRVAVGPVLFGVYYAYDLMFGWLALFLMFLHFPDGQIYPAGAGRWIYRQLVFNVGVNLFILLSTDPLQVPSQVPNHYFQPALLPYANFILALGLLLIMPILLLGLVSMIGRYRGAGPLERQQIKWLMLFIVINILFMIPALIVYPLLTGGQVMNPGSGAVALVFYLVNGLLPPLAIGIAVLRYRLWDIDRIIRRTLIYSLVMLILSLVYLGSVLILQTSFALFFKLGSSDLAIVLSTLAIAALFTPLRGRVQRAIDQRFFRQKYNADQTLARFTATARSEVSLEPLAGALINNVEETMHPEGISLWLVSKG